MQRRALLALAPLAALAKPAWALRDLATTRPAIFSMGQSQTGQGGAGPPRTGPRDTDTVARFPDRLFMFRTSGDANGAIVPGVGPGPQNSRPINRFDPTQHSGFAPYADRVGTTVNAATPFLFAFTARLLARGLLPNGMFGFTAWQGGTALNGFLPPGDPDYANTRAADLDGDGVADPATNYENLVGAIRRYAELTRAEGLLPYVPLIRFEHGEARITPSRGRDADIEHYVAAHLRLTDRLTADILAITGQAEAPLVLLGGWGGSDTTMAMLDTIPEAVRRLVARRPDRYVGPTSSNYMGPFYNDAGASSAVHPGFVGRIIIGEAQALVADQCLDDQLRPVPSGFRALRCGEVVRATEGIAFDLIYRRPPGAASPLEFVVDDWLPATPGHGFEYLGQDSSTTRVVAATIVGADRVRLALDRLPTDPAGVFAYGFRPRDNPLPDGLWNLRGNLVCPTGQPFFYAPILARPPYEIALPAWQRHVAVPQSMALPPG